MSVRLTISSKNYSSWSLRGWLMMKLSGIPFEEVVVDPQNVSARAEILLLSPSILVPFLKSLLNFVPVFVRVCLGKVFLLFPVIPFLC